MSADTPESPSRRRVMGGMAAGLVAGVAAPALAQQQGAGTAAQPRDPTTAYPRPPFPAQQQPWPGLAGKMQPKPDHGETSYRGSGRLAGRKALITGGDSGMGRAAAIAFAREGADVAINYLPDEEPDAREVVQLITSAGRRAAPIPGDIRNEAFCNQLVQDAVRQLGGLDILVNNAGRQQSHDLFTEITTEQFDWTMKTNVYAPFWITKAALPYLKPGSSIIITSSVVAYEPPENLFDYAQTKAANMIYAKVLAKQLAKRGIRVNAVAPGPVWTPLQVTGGQPADKIPTFGQNTPLGRPGQPAELASIYVQLAAADASYATGQVYGATGGRGGP
ncbi:SDR family oxidoreductase [Pedomonas mirosovicensis]|uniref:SDR family oxidoreductase n=1 Tax=Pedomonas mirosovicensis TaxID=2908641 RepID=UPI002168D0E8|nr:SDR family oxidoreductase [Pedomonas mirosovicensis]MCH8684795.1 SDR family oxidoreductase [Pedomonas mirosovicensis]